MITQKDGHVHDFKELSLSRIMEVQPNYHGAAGDTALLLHTCECGKQKAFEIGPYKDMKKLYEFLIDPEKLILNMEKS